MDISDSSNRRLSGEVTFQFCRNGVVVEAKHINLVVDKAYDVVSDWAAQDFSEIVSQIAVGDGGNVPGDPQTPIRPTEDDIALVSELDRKNISAVTKLGANITEYVATFLPGEGTGTLTEAGLFTSSNNLFARVTFGAIGKGSMTLIVRWKITF